MLSLLFIINEVQTTRLFYGIDSSEILVCIT